MLAGGGVVAGETWRLTCTDEVFGKRNVDAWSATLRQAPHSGAFRVIPKASFELDDQGRAHYLTGTADAT